MYLKSKYSVKPRFRKSYAKVAAKSENRLKLINNNPEIHKLAPTQQLYELSSNTITIVDLLQKYDLQVNSFE